MSINIKKLFVKLSSLLTAGVIAVSASTAAFAAVVIDKSSLSDYGEGEYDETLQRVVDDADLLSDREKEQLEEKISRIIDEFEFDCVIVTVDNYRDSGSYSMAEFSDDFFDYGGYGVGIENDGIVFAVSMSNREYFFSTSGYGEIAIDDYYGSYWIEDDVIDYLKHGDYYQCFSQYVDDVYDFVKEAKENKPYSKTHRKFSFKSFFSNWFAAGITALIITAVVVSVLVAQMKTILPQPAAKHYLKNYKERFSQDTFLYSNVTKVRRDSGGSGGSGGGHRTGSSGRSHGGHGGRF